MLLIMLLLLVAVLLVLIEFCDTLHLFKLNNHWRRCINDILFMISVIIAVATIINNESSSVLIINCVLFMIIRFVSCILEYL